MNLRILFITVAFLLCVQFTQSEEDYFSAFLIKIALETTLNEIKNTGHVVIFKNLHIKTPGILDDVIMGAIGVRNVTLYGLSTLEYSDAVDVDKEMENNVAIKIYNIDVNATLEKIGLHTVYELDLNLLNELPLYGKGDIQLEVRNVDIKTNATFNDRNGLKLQDLDFDLTFRSSNESYVTGFWHNSNVSQFITKILNKIERYIAMLYNYHKECFKCIIKQIIKIIINHKLTKEKLTYSRCKCLEGSAFIDKLQEIIIAVDSKAINNILARLKEMLEDKEKLKKIAKEIICAATFFQKAYFDLNNIIK
ncbi:unnamed protein product [Phyllotreta striolata]|uniref:Uncharacterized protein n=1 Tax=Phyllotreta striolata TaxID=444603 RepID=A0A9N9TMT2_PHYSR|nr:unnamed protein product [Phyllotreta striolata]